MPISAVDTISLAIEHTKEQLFRPLRFGQWTRLAFVGLLAGELGSGGGFNGSNFRLPAHPGASRHFLPSAFGGINPALLAGLIAILVVSAFIIGLIFMYISSVMRFILFDSIIAKECRIRQGWSRRQIEGWRYFLWKLLYLLASFCGIAVLIGFPAAIAFGMGWLSEPRQHLLPLILGGVVLFFVLLLFLVSMAVIFVLTKDFVVPQMALEEIGALEGWRRLWPMIQAEMGGYAGYIGMKIVMAIGAGIVIGIATLILGLFIAIPTVGLSILAVLTGKSAGLTWNAYTITLAVVIGCVLLAIVLYLVALISVPVVVFFPAYSIYFFAARYPPLSAAIYPAPLAQPQSPPFAAPPYQPPPLPPSPAPAG
ncbi:MAG: hypothetical protein WAL52_11045 [Candidatus Sulfotelmatobacter sp.]